MGNIDINYVMPFGTPAEIARVVMETIEAAAPGGGYILTSSNSIHSSCNPRNFVAMIEAAKEFGHYGKH